MKKAILIPANPFRKNLGGQDEGSIEANEKNICEVGNVFWRLLASGNWITAEFPHAEIRNGYMYDVSIKNVPHACDISWIRRCRNCLSRTHLNTSLRKNEARITSVK